MVAIITAKGSKGTKKAELPEVFTTEYRPDLIARAFDAHQANLRQPNGLDPAAGLKTSADYFGSRRRSYRQTINRAMTRLPRIKPGGGGLGRVARVPQSVGGHTVHGPQVDKKHSRKINKKEYMKAIKSAIAATVNKDLVSSRNHDIGSLVEFPLVVDDELQKIQKTKKLMEFLKSIGLTNDLNSNKKSKVLIVVGQDEGILNAAKNIPGVNVTTSNALDVDLLAPGSKAGMLTIWTQQSITKVQEVMS